MDIFYTTFGARVIFVLGITNLVMGLMVALSCRCIPGLRILRGKLMQYRAYQRFYSYHCYYWWVFWASVVVHAIFALGRVGVPF